MSRPYVRLISLFIIWLAFALMVSSAIRKSATVDEQSHLLRGVAYVQTGATHFLLGHPLLGGALSALPLLTEPDLRLPVGSPAWAAGDWSVAGDLFLWQANDHPLRLIFLGRLPVIWLTLLLGALVYRWGREWGGRWAGLLALALLLLDPNVLAHGRFITGDLPLTFFFTLTLYAFWRALRTPQSSIVNRQSSIILCGLALGLAAATKFNAALLLPILGVWAGVMAWRERSLRPLRALLLVGLVAWGVIWAVYGFALWRGYLPGGAFWDDFFWQWQYVGGTHGAYLFGEISTTGWWYYFPVVFALKTPLVTLLLVVTAVAWGVWRGSWQVRLFLLLPAGLYVVGSMAGALNIGYRYLIPALPFLLLATAVQWASVTRSPYTVIRRHFPEVAPHGLPITDYRLRIVRALAAGRWWRFAPLLILAPPLLALRTWPDYVPYFNILAGGRGWQLVADSNVDWGQDLPALAAWQGAQAPGAPLYLSYFGMAHPSAYGVQFTPLPTWEPGPEQGNPAWQAYNPAHPAPGLYAISVTNLQGVVLGEQREAFAYFRAREPVARLGGSIFVYSVAATGAPVDVSFSGLRPADLSPDLQAQLGTNDVRPRWFDGRSSLVWPAGGGWLAVADGQRPSLPALAAWWPAGPTPVVDGQALYRLGPAPQLAWQGGDIDLGPLTFLGWQAVDEPGYVSVVTAWRVEEGTERPLQLFIHALDETGQIAAQWDGLDAAPQSWRPGDLVWQWHRFVLPTAAPVCLQAGVYDGQTGERLADAAGTDVLVLTCVQGEE